MAKRRSRFPHRYTTVHLNRDGVRVPFVRLSGRWLEAFDFKEGAKFTAVGVTGRSANRPTRPLTQDQVVGLRYPDASFGARE